MGGGYENGVGYYLLAAGLRIECQATGVLLRGCRRFERGLVSVSFTTSLFS
jgi:hypothetical protein